MAVVARKWPACRRHRRLMPRRRKGDIACTAVFRPKVQRLPIMAGRLEEVTEAQIANADSMSIAATAFGQLR